MPPLARPTRPRHPWRRVARTIWRRAAPAADPARVNATSEAQPSAPATTAPAGGGEPVKAPLAGNIFKVNVAAGDSVEAGQVIVILEAMKMETEVRAARAGTVTAVSVTAGDAVAVGDTLITLG